MGRRINVIYRKEIRKGDGGCHIIFVGQDVCPSPASSLLQLSNLRIFPYPWTCVPVFTDLADV